MIDDLLWLWSVDGIDPKGAVVRDAVKKRRNGPWDASHSREAEEARVSGQLKQVHRDHVVPKNVLLEELLKLGDAPSIDSEIGRSMPRLAERT